MNELDQRGVEPQGESLGSQQGGPSRWRKVLNLGTMLLSTNLRSDQAVYPSLDVLITQSQLILETAAHIFSAQASLWWQEAGGDRSAAIPAGLQLGGEPPSPLIRCASETGQVCCSRPSNPGEEILTASELKAARTGWMQPMAVAAPVQIEDPSSQSPTVLGVLQLQRAQGTPFSQEDTELLEGLVEQAGIALLANRQVALDHWRVEQLKLVRQVSAQIASIRDLDALARQVTSLILDTFHYYYVAVFTLKPGEDILHFRASAGPALPERDKSNGPTGRDFSPTLTVHLGEGIIGHVAETGKELLANDVSREPLYRYTGVLPETQSEVTLPLQIEGRILGVLDVQSDIRDDFNETDLLVLGALAGNIAIAVEGARLYGDLSRRAEQLSTVSEVSNAITSILDLDELLISVVNLIHSRFGYPYVHVFTVHPGRRKVVYKAGSGPRSQVLLEQGLEYDLDDPEGIIPWVARNGETVLANNVDSEPRYRPSELPPTNTLAELAVPLIFAGVVLGLLDIQSDRLNAFGEDDRFLFEALADNIAIAIRNANLYRSEQWRRQVADSLREVAGLLSAEVGLNQVLDAILTELDRTLPCEVAAIWMLDDEKPEIDLDDEGYPPLRLAAVHGAQKAGLDLELGLSLSDVLSLNVDVEEEREIGSWLTDALDAEEPLIRTPQSFNDSLGAALGFQGDYSAIAAPLRIGDQPLGLLTLAHSTSGRYGSEAQAMMAAFASYAAVAIENTRLYEAAHEQAWVSTVLLQVAEATNNLSNLDELLATVVRITPMLAGVKACALYTLDEGGNFIPAAAYGLSRQQHNEFERWRFAPGDVPAFDRLLERKQALILYGEASDPLLTSILFATDEEVAHVGGELLVLVPLLAHSDVTGAFLVDYTEDRPGESSLQAIEARFDERLAIIQGIAHQTAVAADNIRLLKAQKEEAYVSVALLQVAQAVVSSNDLSEILGSIVRITPILVGVKRSLIFLWEADRSEFRLVQAYGIPRSASDARYAPADFPFLETVRQRDTLLACPATESLAEPIAGPTAGPLAEEDAKSPSPPDSWARIPPPSPEEVQEFLDSSERLLLAFPLSVKGDVFGILMVEEPEPVGSESFAGGVPRRLREKRLEITTGISQQAALAIQNNLLQLEIVERERLEREFQLAREIQRSFLPDKLPHLQGWEIDVRWRMAREVGGDFYDFIDLPGKRMGLVIADVADKGMPAALFMTLIRTLVRANAPLFDSPSKVLERINDVLVPDTRDGMFVTIFYAVLSIDTGELTYANAGHNPPLLYNHTQEIFRLEKSGMALGVLENIQIESRRVVLQPGDLLVLYTDGVTEAFSEDEDMYGEQRLRQSVERIASIQPDKQAGDQEGSDDVGFVSAQAIVAAIEGALSDFTGNAPLADDMTLVVLKRSPDVGGARPAI